MKHYDELGNLTTIDSELDGVALANQDAYEFFMPIIMNKDKENEILKARLYEAEELLKGSLNFLTLLKTDGSKEFIKLVKHFMLERR
jgi:hypothetical protein